MKRTNAQIYLPSIPSIGDIVVITYTMRVECPVKKAESMKKLGKRIKKELVKHMMKKFDLIIEVGNDKKYVF